MHRERARERGNAPVGAQVGECGRVRSDEVLQLLSRSDEDGELHLRGRCIQRDPGVSGHDPHHRRYGTRKRVVVWTQADLSMRSLRVIARRAGKENERIRTRASPSDTRESSCFAFARKLTVKLRGSSSLGTLS
jgi:hypothetical protein